MRATARALASATAKDADRVRQRLYLCGKVVRGAAGVKHVAFHKDRHAGRLLVGGNKCLAADTAVLRPDGTTRRIADLWPGDSVLAYDPIMDALVPSRVMHVYANGLKPVQRYVFGHYMQEVALVATADHKVVLERQAHGRDWIDGALRPVGASAPRTVRAVRASCGEWGVAEPRALLLGLLLGDGSLRGSAVQWTCADPVLAREVGAYVATLGYGLKQAGGIQYRVTHRELTPHRIKRVAGRWADGNVSTQSAVKTWLRDLGLWPVYSHQKFIPSAVWNWDRASVQAFVAGLLATDGSVWIGRTGAKEAHAGFSSTSRALLEGLKSLMEVRLGIYGSGVTTHVGARSRPLHLLTFGTAEALTRLAQLSIPGAKKYRIMDAAARPVRRHSRASRLRLRRVEPCGTVDTYDIEIDHPAHIFAVGGGLLVANSAKTTTGAVEARCWLEGTHPFVKTPPPPVEGRLVCPTLPGPEDKPHPQRDAIKLWFPPYLLRGGSWADAYSIAGHTLYLANGSYLEIMSSEQRAVAHSGAGRHFVWFDEEVPRDIWAENVARLVVGEWRGGWWLTMTPILGLLWIQKELYEPGKATDVFGVHDVDIEDNRHNLPEGFIEQFTEALRPQEREIRLHGRWGARAGLIYDVFDAGHLGDFQIEQERP